MYRNSIWITGANGKLGTVLKNALKNNVNYRVIATGREVDVTDYDSVKKIMEINRPNIVINCAGISDKEYCKANEVEAYKVNTIGARNLAIVSRTYNAKIIQISTDDVFEYHQVGKYNEFDVPHPKGIYGKSKLAGERFIKELNPKHLIIRSSWLYGAYGDNYFADVIEMAKKNEPFEASKDVYSTPTCSDTLAEFVLKILEKDEYGIYHASDEGFCSRYEFARIILSKMGYDSKLVKGVFTQDGVICSTVLDNMMMKITNLHSMPDWEQDLDAFIARYKEEN